jgi:hypothetical protein
VPGNLPLYGAGLGGLALLAHLAVRRWASYLMANRDALALVDRRFMGMNLPRGRNLGPVLVVWAISLLVLILENDLGTSLIFFGVFVVMLYVATERTSWVVLGTLMATLGAGVVGTTSAHVKYRVVAWLHPTDAFLAKPADTSCAPRTTSPTSSHCPEQQFSAAGYLADCSTSTTPHRSQLLTRLRGRTSGR